jgi:hypothetical protein
MADKELGKTSPELMKNFTKAVSKEEDLINQREKSLNSILSAELDIADAREKALNKYFDTYSDKLESIKTAHEKLLDNTFSVLNQKLTDHYKSLSSEINRLERDITSGSKPGSQRKRKQTRPYRSYSSDLVNDLQNQAKQTSTRQNFTRGTNTPSSGSTANGNTYKTAGGVEVRSTENDGVKVGQNFDDATRKLLAEARSSENIVDRLSAFKTTDEQIEATLKKQTSAVISIEQLKDARLNQRNQLASDYAQKEIALESTLTKLTMARLQETADRKALQRDIQIKQINEVLDAELEAQEALNRAKAELALAKTPEGQAKLGNLLARRRNAEEDLISQKEVAARVQEFKQKLEDEARAKSAGKLLEDDAIRIEELAAKELATQLANLDVLTQKRAEKRAEANALQSFREANSEAGSALELAKAKFIADEEYKLRQKYGRLLTKEEHDDIKDRADTEFKLSNENLKKLAAIQEREDKKKKREAISQTDREIAGAVQLGGFSKEDNLLSRIDTLASIVDKVDDEDKGTAQLAVALKAISSLAAQLESAVDKIGAYKGDIDTRLQGSNNKAVLGSYWDQLNRDMISVGAVTPYFKQEDFANNIKTLVDKGISFDLKQRAFLMTIQEKIATTFEVADGTLLKLIRIQQEDSTAGRLGMESALNTFLNNMYENTEYLENVAGSVRQSLQEMESLMSGAEATEVEYQVQKWMGSLYSVGMSQDAVNSIANALGQLAAGQVAALTSGNGAGNLIVMAASEAGKSISEILTKGLTATETNDLLQATVNYLAELAESSKDSRVVQQQLANVFGVKASDLRAATNLATNDTINNVYKEQLSYDNMLRQLYKMAGSMGARTSIGEMMTNVWENGQYTLAGSMANNPISYLTYKLAGLLDSTVGGIAIPAVSVAGFGVDLETTVADLMRVASLSTGVLGSIGSIISGLSSSFSGQAMLNQMGIQSGSGLTITPRGSGGAGALAGGGAQSTSGSGYAGNGSPSDILNSTMQKAEDDKKQQMIEAKEEAEATQIDFINENVLKIYELLEDVASGRRNLSIKVSSYGLTSLSNSGSRAQGGVSGLLSNSSSSNSNNGLGNGFSSGSTSGGSTTSTNSGSSSSTGTTSTIGGTAADYGIGSPVDLGGWTMM